jgi:hypothetical protein
MAETVADNPTLAALWDASRNASTPTAVPARSHHPVWWKCAKGHSFQRAPRMMSTPPTCPQCRVGSSSTSIAQVAPGLVALWAADKNGDLTPSTVSATHTGYCWWRCPAGHDFRRAPVLMQRESSCPTCALAETSLAKVNPEAAAEWHATRNANLTPGEIDADRILSAWWTCPKGHDYQATVRARAKEKLIGEKLAKGYVEV